MNHVQITHRIKKWEYFPTCFRGKAEPSYLKLRRTLQERGRNVFSKGRRTNMFALSSYNGADPLLTLSEPGRSVVTSLTNGELQTWCYVRSQARSTKEKRIEYMPHCLSLTLSSSLPLGTFALGLRPPCCEGAQARSPVNSQPVSDWDFMWILSPASKSSSWGPRHCRAETNCPCYPPSEFLTHRIH